MTRHLGSAPIRQCTIMNTKTYMETKDELIRRTKREKRKIHKVRSAGLKTRRSFSYTTITKIFLFLTELLLFDQCKLIIGD
jgi:uncharacterized membrane protein